MTTNAWVDSYLDALVRLRARMSHSESYLLAMQLRLEFEIRFFAQMRAGDSVGEPIHGAPRVDADKRLFANYYVRGCAATPCGAVALRRRWLHAAMQFWC
jgi:hypothetical protein